MGSPGKMNYQVNPLQSFSPIRIRSDVAHRDIVHFLCRGDCGLANGGRHQKPFLAQAPAELPSHKPIGAGY